MNLMRKIRLEFNTCIYREYVSTCLPGQRASLAMELNTSESSASDIKNISILGKLVKKIRGFG